jgi:hypothetical protein
MSMSEKAGAKLFWQVHEAHPKHKPNQLPLFHPWHIM